MLPAYKPVLTLERQTIIYRLKLAAGLELKETNVNVPKCDLNEIGDQFHYIFRCNFFNDDRRKHVPMANVRYPNTI